MKAALNTHDIKCDQTFNCSVCGHKWISSHLISSAAAGVRNWRVLLGDMLTRRHEYWMLFKPLTMSYTHHTMETFEKNKHTQSIWLV